MLFDFTRYYLELEPGLCGHYYPVPEYLAHYHLALDSYAPYRLAPYSRSEQPDKLQKFLRNRTQNPYFRILWYAVKNEENN